MKKLLLSTLVIIAFVSYSLYLRFKGVDQLSVISPLSNSIVNPSPSPGMSPATNVPTAVQLPSIITITSIPTPTSKPRGQYKDGTYLSDVADAFYGNIQVNVTISSGKITDVQFVQSPNDRGTSIAINAQADPILAQEAIAAQSSQVDIVSGATDSSQAFIQAMQSVLAKAGN